MRSFTIAATVLASASTALAVGTASVNNNCNFDVYLWSVGDSMSDVHILKANGGQYSETYQDRQGGGVSIKMMKENNIWGGGQPSQFEYTYVPTGNWAGMFFDISNIDGDPFWSENVELVPHVTSSGDQGGSCNTVTCPPDQQCKDAYNQPDDNFATHECPLATNLVYNICGSNSTGSSSGSSASSSAAPAKSSSAPASSAPAQSATPTPTPTPTPSPSPSPSAQASSSAPAQAHNEAVQAASTPAASPTPVAASNTAWALSWAEGDSIVGEKQNGGHSKRQDAHQNHLARHERIARMHHARSMA